MKSKSHFPRRVAAAFILTVAAVLSGCDDELESRAFDHTPTLGGIDANANGIRDDIDLYLASLELPAEQRSAADQLARAMQEAVTVDSFAKDRTYPISDRVVKGIACVWARLPTEESNPITPSRLVRALEKMTANTEERVRSYMKYNSSLDGSVASARSMDACQ